MARPKKPKPSFDVPAASGQPAETGWVYRSDAVATPAPPAPIVSPPPIATPAPPIASSLSPARYASVVDRVGGWIALPFEIAIMLALVPFGPPRTGK